MIHHTMTPTKNRSIIATATTSNPLREGGAGGIVCGTEPGAGPRGCDGGSTGGTCRGSVMGRPGDAGAGEAALAGAAA
jgi:hypothetical protein